MVILSNNCKIALNMLGTKYNKIYTKEALKFIKALDVKKIKRNIPSDKSIKHLYEQLPSGVYNKISEIENTIANRLIDVDTGENSASPLFVDYKEFMPCKPIKFLKGNIISGRNKEIDSIIKSMCKKDKRGVILTGEAGTGKTSIVRAFASRLIEHTVPPELIGCSVVNMDIPYILTKYKEDPVGTIVKILERASEYDKVIIFIDEVHQLFANKMNDIMKPYLTEKIRFIGSTTTDEYHGIVSRDSALERRFTLIKVKEPDHDETVHMISNTKRRYEDHHRCIIPNSSIDYIVSMANRFMGHRKNPDKSLDILDTACSEVTTSVGMIENKIIPDTFDKLEDRLRVLKEKHVSKTNRIVDKSVINKALSNMTGIEYSKLSGDLDYNKAKEYINSVIFNQKGPADVLSNTVNIIKHVKNNERPLSIFLCIGKAGTGKKYSAKALSEYIFGTKGNFIEYNMSAFRDAFSLTEIKGSPPGYIGYGKSGGLIKKLRDNPQSILYLRNIDKADPGITEYILQGCKSGRLIDSAERVAKLNSSIIIFSITLSDEKFKSLKRGGSEFKMGFTNNSSKSEKTHKELSRKVISNNILDTVDDILIFNDLEKIHLGKIFDNSIDKYLRMYDIKINKSTLKKKILKESSNGHDVISKISSEVPRIVFNKLKQKGDSNGIPKKNPANDEKRPRKRAQSKDNCKKDK